MYIRQVTDIHEISRVFNHYDIFQYISDDLTPFPYIPDIEDTIYLGYSLEKDSLDLVGIISATKLTGTTFSFHIALLRAALGSGKEVINLAADWVLTNTTCLKAICIFPVYNRLVKRLLKDCGFKEEGRITKCFLKNWKLHDMYVYGITKGEFLCQQRQEQQ